MSLGNALGERQESVQLNGVTRYRLADGVAVITLNSPPVNALGPEVRAGLEIAFNRAIADDDARAVVLGCEGRTFIAGADIREFDVPTPPRPLLHDVLDLIESCTKPTVAAIHGTALGGGLETALCCHFRVASPSAKVGLPEVALGLLPGAGGTQRLPRLIGALPSLEIMTFGKPVPATRALQLGLIDEIVDGDLIEGAIAFTKRVIAERRPTIRVQDRSEGLSLDHSPELFAKFRQDNARAFRGLMAPENIIKAVEAAVALPFGAGMKREAELFRELMASRQSAALRYQFFAERQTVRVPDNPADTPQRKIAKVGVIGAGTMGGGIAMNFLNAGVPVTLVERDSGALERGVATIRRNYEATVAKGRLSGEALDSRMGLLTPSLEFADLGQADLIIEAVFERLDLKQDVFARLDKVAKPGAILATNTSFLDVDAIAAATSRPSDVVGLHFFSPANVMRLLEVVRGKETAPDVIATAMGLGRLIAKVPVLSRVCDGFIANRMMTPRMDAAQQLILHGPMPWDVDHAMEGYGFAMGPFAMLDLVGLDVIGWDAAKSSSSTVTEVLCEMGRWGQKRQGGFYDYDERRKPSPSAVSEKIVRDFQARSGKVQRAYTDEEIVERLLFPVVNEGARILEEGIALRASDIDVALVMGYGWPVHTGGPLFWADGVGLDRIVNGLKEMGETPANLLVELAQAKGKLHTYAQKP